MKKAIWTIIRQTPPTLTFQQVCRHAATLSNFVSDYAFVITHVRAIERRNFQKHKRLLSEHPVLFTTSNLLLIFKPANFKGSRACDFTLKERIRPAHYVCGLKRFDERRRFYKGTRAQGEL